MKPYSRSEIEQWAYEAKVKIVVATKDADRNRIAIHLLEPSFDELANALERAERDLFEAIVIHTQWTWSGSGGGDQ